MADNLHHPPFRLLILPAIIRQPYHHLVAGDCPHGAFLLHKDILSQPLVVRRHEAEALALLVGSHHLCDSPGQNLNDLSLPAPAAALRQQGSLHLIPMHGAACLILGDVDILPLLLLYEAKAPGIPRKTSCHQPGLCLGVFSLFGYRDLPLSCQGL